MQSEKSSPAATPRLRVGIFSTCLVGLMRPRIGAACADLARATGAIVKTPKTQTCCGQPAFNGGYLPYARALFARCAAEFAECDRIVMPSGSCCGYFRRHCDSIFRDCGEEKWKKMRDFADKCRELSEFLMELGFSPSPRNGVSEAEKTATYHDCCAGLRELGVKKQPRRLLAAAGWSLRESPECEECCGFGGTFAAKFGEVSAAIAARKCRALAAVDAPTVVMGDLGCMLNIEGRFSRGGDGLPAAAPRILHLAEALTDSPPSAAAESSS